MIMEIHKLAEMLNQANIPFEIKKDLVALSCL